MLATFPAYLPVDIALAVLAAKTEFWKRRPVATISATCGLWTVLAAAATRWRAPNLWAARLTVATPAAAAVSSLAIIYRFAAEARTPPAPETDADAEPGSQE